MQRESQTRTQKDCEEDHTTASIKFGKLNVNINGMITTIIGSILLFVSCVVLGVMVYKYKQAELDKKYSVIVCPYCEKVIKSAN